MGLFVDYFRIKGLILFMKLAVIFIVFDIIKAIFILVTHLGWNAVISLF
jgi:hypothetical protein